MNDKNWYRSSKHC